MKKVIVFLSAMFCLPYNLLAEPILSKIQEVSPSFMTEMEDAFYFSAYDSVNGYALWKSNGTSGGTKVLRSFNTGDERALPRGLYNAAGTLYFCAYESDSGWELWKSDGTEAGTTMVKDIVPGPDDGVSEMYCHLAHIGGTVFFPGVTDQVTNYALLKTDGTAENTVLVKDNNPTPNTGLPQYLFVMNDTLFFVENDGTHGSEYWKCEGPDYNGASTSMVRDIRTGISGGVSMYSIPPIMNGYFYFQGNNGTDGAELWRSDGTFGGTTMVKDINTGGSSSPYNITAANDLIFFNADDATGGGRELWKSDGTVDGTVMVKDINPIGSSSPDSLEAVNGTLYFSADDGTNGEEPWKSDGTEDGTVMLSDINASGGSSSRYFIALANHVYFRADDGISGDELWQTDGTVGNASLVADIGLDSESSWPGNFLVFDNALFFRATYDNSVTEGEGDALFRYGAPVNSSLYWPMFQPAIYGKNVRK